MIRSAATFSLLLLLTCCAGLRADLPATQPATGPDRPMRILFIGNSYTFQNGSLPAIVEAMARSQGQNVRCVLNARGGKSLEWHYTEGTARDAIAKEGPWDVVVLQDHSRQAIDKPDLLFEYARKLDADVKQAGARTVFFMTWARLHQPEKQQVIADAYEKIASELNADVAPVGLAWQRIRQAHPDLTLHTADKSHPTPAGSYLAACIFYRVLLGEPAEPLPAKVRAGKVTIDLPPTDARLLQQAAAAVTPARPVPDRR